MRMDSNRLDELIKKYWDCETSLEEEAQLREYFNGNDVPEQWKETAALFRYFEEQKSKSVEPQFEPTVVNRLESSKLKPEGRVAKLFANAMRMAAGVAVLLLAVYFVRQEIRKTDDHLAVKDTFNDPERAFEETKKALLMISKGFGSAGQHAKKINMINEAREKIQAPASEQENETEKEL
jgi:hypothetical protein